MLSFLRKIRKSFLFSGSARKYTLYALGEIFLIVLGILIALQINNWNESNKLKTLEKKTLLEIRNELAITRNEINTDLQSHLSEIEEMNKIVEHIIHKKPRTNDVWLSFINASRDHQAYPKSSAFENLKSVGLDIIRNDTLRREITQMYQVSLKRIIDRGDYNLKYDIESAFKPYIQQYLDIDESSFNELNIPEAKEPIKLYNGKIKNYGEFVRDRTLLRELQMQMLERSNKIHLHHITIKRLDKVVLLIENELEVAK
jgi:hypothetical protein